MSSNVPSVDDVYDDAFADLNLARDDAYGITINHSLGVGANKNLNDNTTSDS